MKELEIGTYSIPADCKATIINGRIEVTKRKRELGHTEYRCRDCKHRVKGHPTSNRYWETMVCELRPKAIRSEKPVGHQIYYSAPQYGKTCENFELRTKISE